MEQYWNSIPVGRKNAVTYDDLCAKWGKDKRTVRYILHDLSLYDSGDEYILIRSGRGKGFYKTDDREEIKAFRKECLNKGRANFAPVKKINRILKNDEEVFQHNIFNNLKAVRMSKGLSQSDVVRMLWAYDTTIDVPMLSKLERGTVLPSPSTLFILADIYGVETRELVSMELADIGVYI